MPETKGSNPKTWDDQAEDYDMARQDDAVYRSCIELVAATVPSGTRLCLDAGSGTGLSTRALSCRCDTVVALDYSFASLKVLRAKGLKNVLIVQGDLTSLPFRDSALDACVSANALQHLKPGNQQKCAIAELHRVIRDNATLAVSVHHYSRAKKKAGWKKEGKPGQPGIDYIFRFARDELGTLMPRSSIKAAGYYGLLRIPWFGRRAQNTVAKLFGGVAAALGFGHMLIAEAKKDDRGNTG
jgi:SAM-dependent methyltransferase